MKEILNRFLTRNLNEDDVYLEVDLKKLLPNEEFDADTKEEITQIFIDKILERVEKRQVDINGRALPEYSKSYKESQEFVAFGKSEGTRNMRLSGDLLDQMESIDAPDSKIRIGWDDGLQNAKAHGNITGQNGLWSKKRDFFGLSTEDIDEIKKEIKGILKDGNKS